MRFAPKPENDFDYYIRTYYEECKARCNKVEAIAGKWTFRDLIPGMSDFDTRFIVSDDMTDQDWCDMSEAVGEAHLHLCRRFPSWARNLEHLPGLNLTWDEFADERFYYPEYKQWSFYYTETPVTLSRSLDKLFERDWDIKDEYFFLKKFCLYFGRYNRTIDPAINIGVHENKYPLHSRIMHYFLPPMQSAIILLEKRNIAGKNEAIEIASEMFPELRCWEIIREIQHANYENPKWYEEPYLTELEDALEDALIFLSEKLRDVITLIPEECGIDIGKWKDSLNNVEMDPALIIFDHAKFSRLMKGRLKFYANAPAHFDFLWLIQNELGRMGNNFFTIPFGTYVKLATGRDATTTNEILSILGDDLLDSEEIKGIKAFTDLVFIPVTNNNAIELAQNIANIFDPFFIVLSKIIRKAHILSD
jgi:hypothetical protein